MYTQQACGNSSKRYESTRKADLFASWSVVHAHNRIGQHNVIEFTFRTGFYNAIGIKNDRRNPILKWLHTKVDEIFGEFESTVDSSMTPCGKSDSFRREMHDFLLEILWKKYFFHRIPFRWQWEFSKMEQMVSPDCSILVPCKNSM